MGRFFVVIALLCLLAPAGALASKKGGQRIIDQCSRTVTGAIHGHYTQSDYQWALDHLPTDADEYTNCRGDILALQRAAAGGPRRSGGGGGGSSPGGGAGGPLPTSPMPPPSPPTPPTPPAAKAPKSPGPVNVGGGAPITPGGPGITTTSFTHAVPGPMLLVIVLLVLGALTAAGPAIASRVLARRQG